MVANVKRKVRHDIAAITRDLLQLPGVREGVGAWSEAGIRSPSPAGVTPSRVIEGPHVPVEGILHSAASAATWQLADRWPGPPNAAEVARQGREAISCWIWGHRGLRGIEIQASHLIGGQCGRQLPGLLQGLEPSLLQ